MFILDAGMPPISGQQKATPAAGVKAQGGEKAEATSKTGTAQKSDTVTILPLDKSISDLELIAQKETDPTQKQALKSKVIELKAQRLELLIKSGTVTTKDVQDFVKNDPFYEPIRGVITQTITKDSIEKYKKYTGIILKALEKAYEKEGVSKIQIETKLNALRGTYKEGAQYREHLLEDNSQFLAESQRIAISPR
jgi:hypothetical protein